MTCQKIKELEDTNSTLQERVNILQREIRRLRERKEREDSLELKSGKLEDCLREKTQSLLLCKVESREREEVLTGDVTKLSNERDELSESNKGLEKLLSIFKAGYTKLAEEKQGWEKIAVNLLDNNSLAEEVEDRNSQTGCVEFHYNGVKISLSPA